MKKIVCISLFLCTTLLYSVELPVEQKNQTIPKKIKMTRGDVKIMEATENIRFLSQKIVKEYLFFYSDPENTIMQKNLSDTLHSLGTNLQVIASTTKDEDTRNILEFLAYSKEEILSLIRKKPTKEAAILMLDYSETLLEGADSIRKTYEYSFSKEEEMLVASKNIKYLLERIEKYYIALHLGYNSQNNKMNFKQAVEELNHYLARLNTYDYPENIQKIRQKINLVWNRDREILNQKEKYFIPILLSDSVVYLEKHIDTVALYHSQNL